MMLFFILFCRYNGKREWYRGCCTTLLYVLIVWITKDGI